METLRRLLSFISLFLFAFVFSLSIHEKAIAQNELHALSPVPTRLVPSDSLSSLSSGSSDTSEGFCSDDVQAEVLEFFNKTVKLTSSKNTVLRIYLSSSPQIQRAFQKIQINEVVQKPIPNPNDPSSSREPLKFVLKKFEGFPINELLSDENSKNEESNDKESRDATPLSLRDLQFKFDGDQKILENEINEFEQLMDDKWAGNCKLLLKSEESQKKDKFYTVNLRDWLEELKIRINYSK